MKIKYFETKINFEQNPWVIYWYFWNYLEGKFILFKTNQDGLYVTKHMSLVDKKGQQW